MPKRFAFIILLLVVAVAGVSGWVLLRGNNATTASSNYAALGDSVAAGYGLPASTLATSQDTLCGRSAESYPVQVALNRHADLHDYACSGAKVSDLTASQQLKNGNVAPQLDEAFKNGVPNLITISIGANDLNFTAVLSQCYVSDCTAAANTALLKQRIAATGAGLNNALQRITTLSHGQPPKVIVVGYYDLLSSDCTKFAPRITPVKAAWVVARTADFNSTLRQVAAGNKASFAAADFSGHDLCSADPWIQGLTSLGALHPTSAGQAAIAQSVLQVINH